MYFGAIHTLSLRWQLLAWTVLVSLLFNGIFLLQYVNTDWGSNEAQDQVVINRKGGRRKGVRKQRGGRPHRPTKSTSKAQNGRNRPAQNGRNRPVRAELRNSARARASAQVQRSDKRRHETDWWKTKGPDTTRCKNEEGGNGTSYPERNCRINPPDGRDLLEALCPLSKVRILMLSYFSVSSHGKLWNSEGLESVLGVQNRHCFAARRKYIYVIEIVNDDDIKVTIVYPLFLKIAVNFQIFVNGMYRFQYSTTNHGWLSNTLI